MKKLSHNTLILLLNNVGAASLAFVLSVVIARGFGETALGQYATVMAWVFPLSLVVEFGIGTLMTRNVAQQPATASAYLTAVFPIRLGFGVFVIGLISVAAPTLSRDSWVVVGLRIAIWLALIDALFAGYTAIFRAWEVMLPILLLNVGLLVMQLLGTALVIWSNGTIAIFFMVMVGADVIQLWTAWMIWRWLRNRFPPMPSKIVPRALIKQAFPFMLAGVLAIIQMRVMVILIEQTLSAQHVGQYAVASRFMEAARLVPQALFVALLPNLSALTDSPRQLQRTFGMTAALLVLYSILFAGFCLVTGKWLIQLFFGAEFAEAGTILITLAWVLLPATLRALLTLYLYAYHQEWRANFWLMVGVITQLGSGFWALSQAGVMGGVMAMILSEWVVVIGSGLDIGWQRWRRGLVFTQEESASG